MSQIINELSFSGCYANKYAADEGMDRLVMLSVSLGKEGCGKVWRITRDFSERCLADGYTVRQWAHSQPNRDLNRYFLGVSSKAPYLEDLIADYEQDRVCEFRFEGQPALGLGVAYLAQVSALSLDGDPRFVEPDVLLQHFEVNEQGESLDKVVVQSIATQAQAEAFCKALRARKQREIENGRVLVEAFERVFACLRLGPAAEKQLWALSGAEPYFLEIIRHFEMLNEAAAKWCDGDFTLAGIDWSYESTVTLQQFGEQRMFFCADGVKRQFSSHTKIFFGNQRIYFLPVKDQRHVHIGYVGRHLSTVRHR